MSVTAVGKIYQVQEHRFCDNLWRQSRNAVFHPQNLFLRDSIVSFSRRVGFQRPRLFFQTAIFSVRLLSYRGSSLRCSLLSDLRWEAFEIAFMEAPCKKNLFGSKNSYISERVICTYCYIFGKNESLYKIQNIRLLQILISISYCLFL